MSKERLSAREALEEARGKLAQLGREMSSVRFTDRHGDGPACLAIVERIDAVLAQQPQEPKAEASVSEAIDQAVQDLSAFYGTGQHSLDHKIYREQLENVARLAALERERQLRSELEGLYAFKRSVDEALNSGDGSYRP